MQRLGLSLRSARTFVPTAPWNRLSARSGPGVAAWQQQQAHALSSSSADSSREAVIRTKLAEALDPIELEVTDVSGGCGASFSVKLVSPVFQGKTMLQQHRLVNAVLKDELQDIHALMLDTAAPTKSSQGK